MLELGNIVENIEIELIKEKDVGQFLVQYTTRDIIGQVAMHITVEGSLIQGAPFIFDIGKCNSFLFRSRYSFFLCFELLSLSLM